MRVSDQRAAFIHERSETMLSQVDMSQKMGRCLLTVDLPDLLADREEANKRIAELEVALAERQREHEAWEAMRTGRFDLTYECGTWDVTLGDDMTAGIYKQLDPVDAVLTAKQAAETKP